MSAAALHIYPEAIALLSSIPEADIGWQSGSVVMAGILTGILLELFPKMLENEGSDQPQSNFSSKQPSNGSTNGLSKESRAVPIEMKENARFDSTTNVTKGSKDSKGFFDFTSVKTYCW